MLHSYVLYHGRFGIGHKMNLLLYPTNISLSTVSLSEVMKKKNLTDHMLWL